MAIMQLAGGPGGAQKKQNPAVNQISNTDRANAASQKRYQGQADALVSAGYVIPPSVHPPKPPAPPSPPGGGDRGGGGGGYMPFFTPYDTSAAYAPAAAPAPAPAPEQKPPPSEEDYLAGDATYNATISALSKQLQNFIADINAQRGNYELDYNRSIDNLGFLGYDPTTQEYSWDWDDTLTASGRAYQNQLNDFAARNMLQSQGYSDALDNLGRSLADQYSGMETAKNTFMSDLDRQVTSTTDENTAAAQAARAESIMRRAMQYNLT